jgi:hypothetical protein
MDRWFGTCQRRAIFFSPLQGCIRQALPSPENGQYHHQPYQLLRSGRILANQTKAIDRQAVDWNLVVLKIALSQSQYKLLRHPSAVLRSALLQLNRCFKSAGKCDACHFILNGAVRNSALAGIG